METANMVLKPIITSHIETDAYKINMLQVVFSQFSNDRTTWAFKCRNKNVKFTPEMVAEIRKQIDLYCGLKFTDDEIEYLRKTFTWLKPSFLDFLKFWHPWRNEIFVNEGDVQGYNDCGLAIECRGPQMNVMMYEIPILAIVNEVYFAFKYGAGTKDIEFQKRTVEKFEALKKGEYDIGLFSEFGLRRRYSKDMQDWLIKYIVTEKVPGFVGTSNVYLAKKYGVKPVGTMAHEMFQLMQGHHEYNPAYVNMLVLKAWVKEYQTDNGIALTDCVTTDCFLKDFNKTYATLFNGVRHDSGDPIAWGEKMIAHYKQLGIDPATKTLLFSDSLNFEKATGIRKWFNGRVKIAFGIGTYLSNPLDDPLNIVHKMVECNGAPVAKLSDVDGKGMCRDNEYVEYLKRCIDWRLRHER
jgi:nicotinate phosphoribosyltransferase